MLVKGGPGDESLPEANRQFQRPCSAENIPTVPYFPLVTAVPFFGIVMSRWAGRYELRSNVVIHHTSRVSCQKGRMAGRALLAGYHQHVLFMVIIYTKSEKDPSDGRKLTTWTRFHCPIWQSHEQMTLKIWLSQGQIAIHNTPPLNCEYLYQVWKGLECLNNMTKYKHLRRL